MLGTVPLIVNKYKGALQCSPEYVGRENFSQEMEMKLSC